MAAMKKNNRRFEWLVVVFLLLFPLLSHAAEMQPGEKTGASISDEGAGGPAEEMQPGEKTGASISDEGAGGPAEEMQPGEKAGASISDEGAGGPGEDMQEEEGIVDPLESWNRVMFTVNDRLYFWVMKPTAKLYNFIIPEWG